MQKNGGDWKEQMHYLLKTCQDELKKTTQIGKRMVFASRTNASLRESYEELGHLVCRQLREGKMEWDNSQALEEYFSTQLFERKNRGLFLTKEGQLALKYAEHIFEQASELTSRLRNNIKIPKRSIDIGITHHMGQYFLYDTLLPLFNQKEISVNIRENERHLLLAELEEGNIDMMFTDNKDNLPSHIDAYRTGLNRTFAVAHKKFLKTKKSFPDALKAIPFFNYTNESFLRYEIELFFSKNSIYPKIIGESDNIDFFGTIVEKGLGFVIIPEAAKNRFCLNKNIIVLGELEELQTSVWGVIKQDYKGLGHQLLRRKL